MAAVRWMPKVHSRRSVRHCERSTTWLTGGRSDASAAAPRRSRVDDLRRDGLADWAELTIGIRLPPDLEPDALAHELAEQDAGGQLHFHSGCLAYRGEKNTPLDQVVRRNAGALILNDRVIE